MPGVKKVIILLFIMIFMVSSAAYASPPYYGYNYDDSLEAVPSLEGYMPEDVLVAGDLGLDKMKNPSDLNIAPNGDMYIADTGNNRVLVIGTDLKLKCAIDTFNVNGGEETFNGPEGVCVTEEGDIYIADTQNGRIVILDKEGAFKSFITTPKSEIIAEDFVFLPQKLVVDKAGRVYVVAQNVVEGIIQFDASGNFKKFFGSNRVKTNPMELLWRKILSKEQVEKRVLFVPTEYSNLTMDKRGFLYTTTRNVTTDQIKRLNASGDNIIRTEGRTRNQYGDLHWSVGNPQFLDLCVDEYGNVITLEANKGRLYQYNILGDLLFIFGGRGVQKGIFKNPVAVDQRGDYVYVLDSNDGSVTIFKVTEFGRDVLTANNLYIDGKYTEALKPWREVIRKDANYDLAYIGIGNALLKQEQYKEAMKYFKLGYDVQGHSKALKEYRTQLMRDNFSLSMTLIFLFILLWMILNKVFKKRGWSTRAYLGSIDLGETFRTVLYAFHVILHPFDGFWELQHQKKKTMRASLIILFMVCIVFILKLQLTDFKFNSVRPENLNLLTQLSSILLPLIAWVIVNWAITTLLEGKGTMKHIWVATVYALFPLILLYIPQIILSHVMTLEEGVFYHFIDTVAVLWCTALLLIGSMTIHDYTMSKTVTVSFFTIIGILSVSFIGMVFFSTVQQLFTFFTTVYLEIKFMV